MSIRKELTAQNVLLGFQHVLVSNVWLDPVFVAGAIGLPIALSSNMINAIFIVSGLVTLVQATRLVRLPVVQGPSAAFDALMIAAGTAGMLGAASSSILIASLVFLLLCLTGVIERMRFLFSPMISGVVIFMVGVSLSGFTLSEFLGGAPGDKTFADPHILTVSILTTAIVLVLSLLGKGLLKSFSFLIALVVGTVVAAAFGMVDFSPVASKGWLGLPTFLPYGPFTFDWKIFIPFFIAYMVAVMEALGVYQAASEIQGTSLERKQVRYGLARRGGRFSHFLADWWIHHHRLPAKCRPAQPDRRRQVAHAHACDHRRCAVADSGLRAKGGRVAVRHSLGSRRRHFPAGCGQPNRDRPARPAQGR